jgi:hypothetical protein
MSGPNPKKWCEAGGKGIIINERRDFSIDCPAPNDDTCDLQTTVLHELGHALGLGHAPLGPEDIKYPLGLGPAPEDVMWKFVGGYCFCRRVLAEHDIDRLILLYGPRTRIPPANTPLPISPADGTTIIAKQTQLDWEDSSNANSYYVQVSASADFLNPMFKANPTQSFVGSIPGLDPGITYYWRVKAKGTGGNSTWSEISEFATGAPRLPAVYEQSESPILEPGEETEIYFALQNIGSDTWESGHYALVNVNGLPLGAPSQMALDVDVPSGSPVTWRFSVTAPVAPGIYRTEWRFSYDGQLIGPLLWTDIIVIPGGSDDLAGIIRSMIEEARREAGERIDELWEELRRRILEMIWAEIVRQIQESLDELCGGSAAATILPLSALWLGHRRSRVGNREH